MERKILLILLFLSLGYNLRAQIIFINPEFEDISHDNYPPQGWDSCYGSPDCDEYESSYPWYLAAYQGKTYLGLQCDYSVPPPNYEITGQMLSSCLVPGKVHSFTLFSYEVSYIVLNFLSSGAQIRFWGGFNK